MSNDIFDENMDLSALKNDATELRNDGTTPINDSTLESKDETTGSIIGENWWEKDMPVVTTVPDSKINNFVETTIPDQVDSDSSLNTKPILPPLVTADDRYEREADDGYGLVVENFQEKEEIKPLVTPGGITDETKENVNAYLKELDGYIEVEKERHNAIKSKEDNVDDDDDEEDEKEENPPMTKDEFQRAYEEAVVVIDKTGMGQIINFTDAERDKLERSKKIKLEEVETISLQTIKTKKMKKKESLDTILKKKINVHSTPIVLPASGYTASMRGCSTYELVSLMGTGNKNALLDTQAKWTLIHSKLEESSIGKMDYNEFLLNTAALDYPIFLYGLLCATYPDDDKIPLKCEKCKKDFDHKYSIKSLIRAEKMGEKLKEHIMNTIDNSGTLDLSKKYHSIAAVSQVKVIKLPVSGIVAEVYVQSAYDFINRSIKELADNKEANYNQAAMLSSVVNKLYIPDEGTDEYYEIDGAMDITKTIYNLGDTDILVLTKQGDLMLQDLSFEFGLMDITCPHCKFFTPTVPIDLESILFFKYQQAMTTKIE